MAAIDKTYVKTWKEYTEVRDWCLTQGEVIDDYGISFKPIDFVHEYTKEQFDAAIKSKLYWIDKFNNEHPEHQMEREAEVALWNTPYWFDYWLIRHCPIKLVQDRLHEQYSNEEIEDVLNFRSVYDNYKRINKGKNIKFKVVKKLRKDYKSFLYNGKKFKVSTNNKQWFVEVHDTNNAFSTWNWSDVDRTFYSRYDLANRERIAEFCIYYNITGVLDLRKVHRLLKHWNLPAGLTVKFCSRKFCDELVVETK